MTLPLWTPDIKHITTSQISRFRLFVNQRYDLELADDQCLYQWSVDQSREFWAAAWQFFDIVGEPGNVVMTPAVHMRDCRFFPEATLNYTENLLLSDCDPQTVAIHFWGEDKLQRRVTHGELRQQVSQAQQFLRAKGVVKGDRIAAMLPNTPETLVAMLATASLGAVWSSASPDFGVQGIMDRFGQITPKILFVPDGYYYNGKWIACDDKVADIITQLQGVETIVRVAYDPDKIPDALPGTIQWHTALAQFTACDVDYTRVPFDHPLFIMFSSGTTGKPKCIVHGTGGPLLQLVKEHRLHCDIVPGDRVFYFTTCSWMMWNWQVTALASGAILCLYDGSPFAPDGNILFDYCDAVDFTLFGTSAKFIDTLHKQQYDPKTTHRLTALKTLTSTGSVLTAEGFDYVYDHIKSDLHLASISGGTDIVSCFVLGYPTRPVIRGEIQGAGLGLAMDVVDGNGVSLPAGEKGEMVCTQPFPCMPVGFWDDADGTRYHDAYFNRFDNVWTHGDYAQKTPSGGFIIHGRSDATLNPGGVRIGTAEIYRQVEQLPEIIESIVVGQTWQHDERIILFVILARNVALDQSLQHRIRAIIRTGTSPRHLPAKIIAVTDIPRTKNNKISEIAVRDTINGKPVAHTTALANPEVLAQYRDLPELQQD